MTGGPFKKHCNRFATFAAVAHRSEPNAGFPAGSKLAHVASTGFDGRVPGAKTAIVPKE